MKRRIAWILLAIWAGSLSLAAAEAETLFQVHFAGKDGLGKPEDGSTARTIAARPATTNLISMILDKVSAAPTKLWQDQLPAEAGDTAGLIRPLLNDFLDNEFRLELVRAGDDWAWIGALHLNADAGKRWNTHLLKLMTQWKLGDPKPQAAPNGEIHWQLRNAQRRLAFDFAMLDDWVLFRSGVAPVGAFDQRRESVRKTQRPFAALEGEWITLHMDTPKMRGWSPRLAWLKLPIVDASAIGEGEYLKTSGRFTLNPSTKLSLEPWNIPTNIIHDPLVSFTVGRGMSVVFKELGVNKLLNLESDPNQFCLWGKPSFYGQSLMTSPTAKPTNAITRMAPKLPARMQNAMGSIPGQVYWQSNKSEIVWKGLPFLTPFIKPIYVDKRPYLITGLVPILGKTNPPPPELFAQIDGKPNLVYYSWEITEKRLLHNRHYFQLGSIIAGRRGISTDDLSFLFLQDIHTNLGNTITEVTLTKDHQLDFVRRSHVGFSGLELVLLARWAEAPGFPLAFDVPKSTRNIGRRNITLPPKGAKRSGPGTPQPITIPQTPQQPNPPPKPQPKPAPRD